MNDFSKYLVWVIPNAKNPENNLDEKVYSLEYNGTQKEHREFLENFVESHNLNHKGRGGGHLDYALTLVENGISVGMNSGIKIGGKYSCMLFLNENLSDYQIEMLESQKEIFNQKFYHDVSFFPVMVYSTNPVNYRSANPNLRDLNIEAIINRNPDFADTQKLLYQHLDDIRLTQSWKR